MSAYAAIDGLHGWMTPERAEELRELVLREKPKICVELGTFGGQSLITIASALRDIGTGIVYGVDPWKTEAALEGENDQNKDWWSNKVNLNDIHTGTMEAIWQRGLDEWAVVIRAKSQHCPMLFGMLDLLLIDGNHSEVASTRDAKLYLPMVVSGGIVIADDLDWPTTQKMRSMIEEQCERINDNPHYGIYRKR
jgi:predicted O-methyltransferase YrrM